MNVAIANALPESRQPFPALITTPCQVWRRWAYPLLRIVRLRSKLVQNFYTSQPIRCKCSSSKVRGQGHKVKDQVRGVK